MRAEANDRAARRIEILDVARGVALIAMAVYHFTWDLEFFGYLPRGFAEEGGWRLFARTIATSFLVLVGIGVVLGHGRGIRWRPFGKRLAQICAGALAITIATIYVTPQGYVFFGILHQIAVASLIGLAFLRLPFWATAMAGVAVIVLPTLVSTGLTDPRWLAWIGFSARPPVSNDFVPVFPWTGPVLLGMALAQLCARLDLWPRLARLNPHLRPAWPLGWLGRHSLAFYLIHQPVSIGLVAAFAQLMPPDLSVAYPNPGASFRQSCISICTAQRDSDFCNRYCECTQTELEQKELLLKVLADRLSEEELASVRDSVNMCSFSAEP